MKKKIFLLLTVLFCLCAALTLSACSHTHTLIRHAATEPTCAVDGYLEYWECTACGKFFPDSSANAELADLSSMAISALGHDPVNIWKSDETGHWYRCTRTGCAAQVNKTAHAPAAWSSDATNHWGDCAVCGYDIPPAAHTYNVQNICTACAYVYEEIGLVFTLENGTYTVTDYTGTATEVVIPSAYKGVAVTSIGGSAFDSCDSLTTITIPDSVTSIGSSAFSSCSQLTTVTFGANSKPTSIGYRAFYGCSNLTSITIPDSVTSIGDEAFYECDSLTTITIPDSVTSIGEYAFILCSQLTTVEFGANSKLTSIGDEAFYYCDSLTTITIPDSVTSIGNGAFSYCSQLTTITIPDGVTSIGAWAFSSCSQLTTITIPAGVTSIGDSAFYKCSNLTTITIPAGVIRIGSSAFYGCSQLTTITIPDGVTSIGNDAFYGCSQLTTVYYGGSASDWEKIWVGFNSNSDLTSATRYYYSATKPIKAGKWWYYDQNGKPVIWE